MKRRRRPNKDSDGNLYNSYNKFQIDNYEKGTQEWELAMLQYLLDMKQKGHHIREVESNKVSVQDTTIINRVIMMMLRVT